MRTRTVKVHHCDHCNRRKFYVPHMVKHEAECFMNPARSACPMCKSGVIKTPVEMAAIYDKGGVAALRLITECPACINAGIGWFNFHSAAPDWDWTKEDMPREPDRGEFDYKAECKAWNEAHREERHDFSEYY